MAVYTAAAGFDNAAGLAAIADSSVKLYAPRAPLNAPGNVVVLSDGSALARGGYGVTLQFDGYLRTTQMRALLEALDLRDSGTGVESESAEITITLPGMDRSEETWNAIAYHPHAAYERGRFAALEIRLLLVEQLA